MMSSRFGSEYLKNGGERPESDDDENENGNDSDPEKNNEMLGKDDDGGVEAFLMGSGTMRESEEFDDTKSNRSATNLMPFKKDLGNRFSKAGEKMNTRVSFLDVNPLARSAASTIKVKHSEIAEDLDESHDSA